MSKVVFKVLKQCQDCENNCKKEVNEIVWIDGDQLLTCGDGKKFKKKKK